MASIADVEISLRRSEAASTYAVDLKSSPATADADEWFTGSAKLLARALNIKPTMEEYGNALSDALFETQEIRDGFVRARTLAQAAGASLRVRLLIDSGAPELHLIRWEALRAPSGEELLNGNDCWFSRYLASTSWKAVAPQPKTTYKALVLISSPPELKSDSDGLKAIPVDEDKAWITNSLCGISLTFLASGAADPEQWPTIRNLTAQLQESFDIVFLVCHGAMQIGADPVLWLERDQAADVVPAQRLVDVLKRLEKQPRLIVLASCQSAGTGSADALTALGPQLAAAGVPAVVAMQGKVAIETVNEFMPEFFKQLRTDGQIDRAMAVARGISLTQKRKDYWMPVLFMRLRSGSLWYKPGFGASADGEKSEFERWATIKGAIEDRQCTPILGPGMVEGLLGSSRALAQTLATKYKFPLSASALEDLPTVAQYLAVNQGTTLSPRRELRKSQGQGLLNKFGDQLKDLDPADLAALTSEAGKLDRAKNPADPHRLLAALPFEIYITVNTDSLMEEALIEAGRSPRSDFARWNAKIADVKKYPTLRDREPDYRPSVKAPLVYHLYGQLSVPKYTQDEDDPKVFQFTGNSSVPESLVLTEDDYFDYLLRIGSKADGKSLIPGAVGTALTANALLFIGFRLDDWGFRVLLRSIYSKEGSEARAVGNDTLPCVGAQITPEEDRILDPLGTRKYFEQYLRSSNIDIFWGGVNEFVTALDKQSADLRLKVVAKA